MGGGWHGNIGIVFGGVKNGGNTNDKICVGDPNLDTNSEKAEEASRRVYRGMLTKKGSGVNLKYIKTQVRLFITQLVLKMP